MIPIGIAFALSLGGASASPAMPMDPTVAGPPSMTSDSFFVLLGGSALIAVLVSALANMPILGYYWELIDRWQTQGMNAPIPLWKGNVRAYYKSGFQMFLATMVLWLPMVLGTLPLMLLTPLMVIPFLLAAREKTCLAVFKAFPQSFSMLKGRYVPILLALYVILFIGMVYNTVMISLIFPTAFTVTALYLLTEQLGYRTQPAMALSNDASMPMMENLPVMMMPPGGVPTMAMMTEMNAELEKMAAIQNEGFAAEAPDNAVMVYPNPQQEQPETSMLPAAANTPGQGGKVLYFHMGDNPWLRHM